MQDNKAYGLYSSPVKLLKLASEVTSVPLASIFNQSISSGIFPSKLKRAKIVPIFKDEDDSLPENYSTYFTALDLQQDFWKTYLL